MRNRFTIAVLIFCFVVMSAFALLTLHPVDSDEAVTFVIKNFGINTKGELKGLKGSIQWNEETPTASTINVSADVSTINTGIDGRDSHLKKEEYFNADKYPVISFVSTGIATANNALIVSGNLNIKGIKKTIAFPFTVNKTTAGYVFNGSFTINRRDFGVGKSSMVLADDVTVTLKIQAMP